MPSFFLFTHMWSSLVVPYKLSRPRQFRARDRNNCHFRIMGLHTMFIQCTSGAFCIMPIRGSTLTRYLCSYPGYQNSGPRRFTSFPLNRNNYARINQRECVTMFICHSSISFFFRHYSIFGILGNSTGALFRILWLIQRNFRILTCLLNDSFNMGLNNFCIHIPYGVMNWARLRATLSTCPFRCLITATITQGKRRVAIPYRPLMFLCSTFKGIRGASIQFNINFLSSNSCPRVTIRRYLRTINNRILRVKVHRAHRRQGSRRIPCGFILTILRQYIRRHLCLHLNGMTPIRTFKEISVSYGKIG